MERRTPALRRRISDRGRRSKIFPFGRTYTLAIEGRRTHGSEAERRFLFQTFDQHTRVFHVLRALPCGDRLAGQETLAHSDWAEGGDE